MKKLFLFLLALTFISLNATTQSQQIIIGKNYINPNEVTLVAERSISTTIKFNLNELNLINVVTDYGNAVKMMSPEAPVILEAGSPELIYLPTAIIIPDVGSAELEITYGEYTDFENVEIAPSKGNLSRSIDPETVPYVKGKAYDHDAFFPGVLASLNEPFIMRDIRGQTLFAYPVQYNPVTKMLRVYSELTITVNYTANTGVNEFTTQKRNRTLDPTFNEMYSSLFINHFSLSRDYPTEEAGELLIICHPAFMDEMKPYVDWKRTMGRKTTMIPTTTAGSTATQIKSYIQNYYNAPENNLAYVLLVGDSPQIPHIGTTSVPSDNIYGQLVGTDPYMEILIGRMSAENIAHVQTQVERSIWYERDMTTADTWLSAAMGIARNEGNRGPNHPNGHDGQENDYRHMDSIRVRLIKYGYNPVHQDYDYNCPGVTNTSSSQMSQRINGGVGMINFCNHGDETGWSVGNYSNSNVNALQNAGKLPYIFSVACLNGKFTYSQPCFAETWMRATQNNQPKGAIAVFMATINLGWGPTMTAQDEFVNICMDMPSPYSGQQPGIKRTFAGACLNATQKMLLRHGVSDNRDDFNSWTVFGDPTLMIRTRTPQPMIVSHEPVILFGMNEFVVNCDAEGALVTMSYINESDEVIILGTAVVEGGTANLTLVEAITQPYLLTVCAVAKNRVTYLGEVLATPANGPYVVTTGYTVVGAEMLTYISVNREIAVTLKNVGTEVTNPATVTISCDDPQLTITNASAQVGSIAANGTAVVNFRVTVANDIPNNKTFPVNVTVSENGRARIWEGNLTLKAFAPSFSLEKVLVNGVEGGSLAPDMLATITAVVKNTGNADAYTVRGSIAINSPHVTPACDILNSTPQTLHVGETMELLLAAIVSPTIPANHTANLSLSLLAQYGLSFEAPFTASNSGSNGYCTPGTTNCSTYSDRFTSVQLIKTSDQSTLINHAPTCSSGGYNNHTNMEIILIPGQQYTIKVKIGYQNHRVRGWFDLNGNKNFDTGEDLINITCASGNTEYLQIFTVPENIVPGTHRFRLRTRDGGTAPADACGSYTYGQTLDYTIIVPEIYPRVQNVDAVLSSGTNSITVTWDAPDDEAPVGYNIYRNGNRLNTTPLTNTNFTEGNITEGLYVYQVTAVFENNKESLSQMSNVICNQIVSVLCESPVNLTVISDHDCEALIRWAEPEMDGMLLYYNIYRNGVKIAEPQSSVLEYLDEWLPDGVYEYQVSATYAHCENSPLTDGVEVTVACLGITHVQTASFEIFPNPASGLVVMKGNGLNRVEIFNLQGRKVAGYQVRDLLQINVINFESGVYFVKMYSEDNEVVVKRLVIVK